MAGGRVRAAVRGRAGRVRRDGLPLAATVLTGTVALLMLLVVFGNITDFDTNRQFVRHVLAMDTTFQDDDLTWRAVTSRPLQDLAYFLIIAWEALTAAVLTLATARWLRALRHGPLAPARRATTLGLVLYLLLFGAGFLAVGGEWFAMWQSSRWNGVPAAERQVVLGGLVLLVVHLPGLRDDGVLD
ncbi:DUF2165 domain-containing protein [Streptomyces huiliensis]|uniref:DUF2165 domain-containing protein n=1 Tax=Streptomyces huiliensis TaxID=2876027 RepID=UPI001CBEDEA6|nr:DUF2165 domain-containing protein [Streptomyces huiliensis]MBZ4322646.1 DUF2165 domain-containing protein [Streptomyces huiliensis]